MENVYIVVDKETGNYEKFETRQQAWSAWQECWVGKTGSFGLMDRFGFGELKNMKKYLKKEV